MGWTKTKLLITCALEGTPTTKQQADPLVLVSLSRIGNNLNQVARSCNYRNKIGEPTDIMAVLLALRRLREEVRLYAFRHGTNR